jgi:hypothetical protein
VLSSTKDKDLTFNRTEGYPQSVDVARAKECAEHFGECSVEEMDNLRKSECNITLLLSVFSGISNQSVCLLLADLHKERIKRLFFAENQMAPPSNEMLQHLIFPSLFPKDKDEMAVLPHLKDKTTDTPEEHRRFKKAENFLHTAEVAAMEQEAVLNEGTLEAATICLAIATWIFLHQLFHI